METIEFFKQRGAQLVLEFFKDDPDCWESIDVGSQKESRGEIGKLLQKQEMCFNQLTWPWACHQWVVNS